MEVVIQLKKSIAGTSILCIVIGEFSYGQQVSLVILFVVEKDPEISFHNVILPFYLFICLRLEDGRESLLDA